MQSDKGADMRVKAWPWRISQALAVIIPLAYIVMYTPYGMDTTDFGFFYGYAWRIVQGDIPYRDFYYINPSLPLFWHALWIKLTPASWGILGGKLGFVASMLGTAWLTALYLNKVFDLRRMGVPVSLLATTGFVWGVHTFAHVPWHTVDGALFASGALYAGACGLPLAAGVLACMAMLTKQSFLLIPLGVAVSVYALRGSRGEALRVLAVCALGWAGLWAFLHYVDAWQAFRLLTSKPLDIREALEAGIYIYVRQEWWLPALALVPWLVWRLRFRGRPCPELMQPALVYLTILAVRYMHHVGMTRTWQGFGESWPTLWLVLGGLCVLLPTLFLRPWLREASGRYPLWRASAALGAAVLVSWSVGISGGYKTPALYAVPLVFALLLTHARLGGRPVIAAWTALVLGLLMFRVGYEYPYTFPIRQLSRSALTYDAGAVFPKASGVLVDREMFETLRELRDLRARYGARYRVLPGFPHAYFLTDDKPAFPSEWLMDWQIAHQFDEVYQQLLDSGVTVFMLRDQMDTVQADGYARAGYTVPQMVRKRWRVVEETPHFVVMRPPLGK